MNKKSLLASPYVIWISAFILIPLIFIVYYGITDQTGAFTIANLLKIIEAKNLKALWLSLLLSLVSTAICLILAYPLAMILSASKNGRTSLVIFVFILPMWMNGLLRTYAWQAILENNGILNSVLRFFGLSGVSLINTPSAIIIGMIYNYLPFMILPIYNTLSKIDPDIINASRDLGANSLQLFGRIILPLSIPGVISGIIMVFIPALTTFVISDILGGSKILLIGNVIEQEFKSNYNWHVGSALSLVLMVFIFICIFFTGFSDGRGENAI